MTDPEKIAYLLQMVHDLSNRVITLEGKPPSKPSRWKFLWKFITG
jgi:hypothetical protein